MSSEDHGRWSSWPWPRPGHYSRDLSTPPKKIHGAANGVSGVLRGCPQEQGALTGQAWKLRLLRGMTRLESAAAGGLEGAADSGVDFPVNGGLEGAADGGVDFPANGRLEGAADGGLAALAELLRFISGLWRDYER